MKTLIIHPKDRSTDFLKPIYENIPYKTIITGGVTMDELNKEIEQHDRIFMMGHGCPVGLFSVGRFINSNGLVISSKNVELLRGKECVYIWCNADQFVKKQNLIGFYSGMFISEVGEAEMCGFHKTTLDEVTMSNDTFSLILGKHVDKPLLEMYENTKKDYGQFIELSNSKVGQYNYNRLYCNTQEVL
jgi:hypothetical protein